MKKKSASKIYFRIMQITIISVIAYILVVGGLEKQDRVKQKQPAAVLATEASTASFPVADTRINDPFTFLNLNAKGAIVYDLNNDEIIFSQKKDDILPIASITKLMTVYTASRILSPDSIVTIRQEDIDFDPALILGESWSFKNLVIFTLVSSSNGGANAIAREAQSQSQQNFVTQMNETAKIIGLQNTSFRNVTGLDIPQYEISGSYSTAQDVAHLYAFIFKNNPELLENTNKAFIIINSLDSQHGIANTNEIINQIPNLISSKTGTTPRAGGNLAILFSPKDNHPIVIVVLGGTPDGRFVDMTKLIKDTLRILE